LQVGSERLPRYRVTEVRGAFVRLAVERRTAGLSLYRSFSVRYATVDGTAVAGSDFTAKSGELGWNAGETSRQYIDIPILLDSLAEGKETFTVMLYEPAGGDALVNPSVATVTIRD